MPVLLLQAVLVAEEATADTGIKAAGAALRLPVATVATAAEEATLETAIPVELAEMALIMVLWPW